MRLCHLLDFECVFVDGCNVVPFVRRVLNLCNLMISSCYVRCRSCYHGFANLCRLVFCVCVSGVGNENKVKSYVWRNSELTHASEGFVSKICFRFKQSRDAILAPTESSGLSSSFSTTWKLERCLKLHDKRLCMTLFELIRLPFLPQLDDWVVTCNVGTI